MSTRSVIAKEIGEDKYKAIYCHNDGYPAHHGIILLDSYNSPEKVEALLALGNISVLGRRLCNDPDFIPTEKRRFQEDTTVAYDRDYHEQGNEAQIVSMDKMTDSDRSWADYVYIFTKENEWKYIRPYMDREKIRDLKSHPDVFLHVPLVIGEGSVQEKILAIMQDYCEDVERQYGGTWDTISISLLAENVQCSETEVKEFMEQLGAKIDGNRVELNDKATAARRAIAERPNFSEFVWDIREKYFAAKETQENECGNTEEERTNEESEMQSGIFHQ